MAIKQTLVSAAIFGSLVLTGCASTLTKSPLVLNTVIGTVEPYFHGPEIDGILFEQLTERIYTFRWNWYRNIVIDTNEGLVIIDPMNAEMANALKIKLDMKFPGKPVHTLFYSHYHLDHTSGGAVLNPLNVLTHEKSNEYWDAVDSKNVLRPTQTMSGDQVYNIGGVEIRALYHGLSHTDTLSPYVRIVVASNISLRGRQ